MAEVKKTAVIELSELHARQLVKWIGSIPLANDYEVSLNAILALHGKLENAVEQMDPPKPKTKRRWWQ